MTGYVALDMLDLALAAAFVVVAAALSLLLELGVARRILIAATRTIVQLTAIGFVLKALFALSSPWWTLAAALFMVGMAGYEVMARQERRLKGWWAYGVGTTSMMAAAMIVTLFALTAVIQADPWYAPRFALPLLGMILGNTMNGISLGLNSLTAMAKSETIAIEAQLALGCPRFKALRPVIRHALRTALTPIINAMSAAGVISLPGMMTGQILAGADPVEATKYQVLIMFLIAGGTSLGAVSAVMLGAWRLTDARHRLRLDRLTRGQRV